MQEILDFDNSAAMHVGTLSSSISLGYYGTDVIIRRTSSGVAAVCDNKSREYKAGDNRRILDAPALSSYSLSVHASHFVRPATSIYFSQSLSRDYWL